MTSDRPLPTASAEREHALAEAFVTLADTLVSDYDVADLLEHLVRSCVDILGAAAAGLVIADASGQLAVAAASATATGVLERSALQRHEGPAWDCYRTGAPILITDLAEDHRWPEFGRAARELGFVAVQALPMRLRGQMIGALTLFDDRQATLDPGSIRTAQALADVATIGLLHHRAVESTERLAGQLQHALDQRIAIEQAKGLLAERGSMSIDAAFDLLRRFCRSSRLPMSAVAREVVSGYRDADEILAGRWPDSPGESPH